MILSGVTGAVGVLLLILGWLIWKKEKIGLLQEYHRDQVSGADRKRFCTLSGMGVCIIGLGLVLSAVLYILMDSLWCFAAFGAGFLAGIGLLVYAIRTYNRK